MVSGSQINCTFQVGLPKRLPSISGHIELTRSLSGPDRAIIDALSTYERQRLGLENDFLYMITPIKAVDQRLALDIAYKNIKYGLGVLHLVSGRFGITKRFGIPHAPLGTFLSASPIFTIDRKRRELGGYLTESYFPVSFKQHFIVRLPIPTEEVTKLCRSYLSDIKKTDFPDKIVQAIILLQEGLETPHIEIALLKFWTGIELLCSRETREPTERVVERASSMFPNPKTAKIRLNFIQEFRNKIVHRGEGGDHSVLCAQWGSVYLLYVIRFFLFNIYRIRRHAQILDYLSTPLEVSKLKEMIYLYRTRLRAVRKRGNEAAPG